MQLSDFDITLGSMANLNRNSCTKLHQNRPRFVKDTTDILVFFQFTVLTAVHLQNTNAQFHKVG